MQRRGLILSTAWLFLAASVGLASIEAETKPNSQGTPVNVEQAENSQGKVAGEPRLGKSAKNGKAKKSGGKGRKKGGRSTAGNMPQGIYVRITPLDSPMKGVGQTAVWVREQHTAQSILSMISELKPDVIDRFTTGKQNPDYQTPGSPPMNLVEFLDAAAASGAPGCILTAKVHLNDIWSDDYRLAAAQSLRDLPVTPRMTALDLDCYFSGGNAQEHKRTLQRFKEMGFTDLGFNMGGGKNLYGYGSYAMACVNRNTWKVSRAQIDQLKRQGVRTPLLHIDYPRAIGEFKKLPPDRQADILKHLRSRQNQYGFRLIYPILYSGYDATKIVTSPEGPYHGATLFEVMKQMIAQDRN